MTFAIARSRVQSRTADSVGARAVSEVTPSRAVAVATVITTRTTTTGTRWRVRLGVSD